MDPAAVELIFSPPFDWPNANHIYSPSSANQQPPPHGSPAQGSGSGSGPVLPPPSGTSHYEGAIIRGGHCSDSESEPGCFTRRTIVLLQLQQAIGKSAHSSLHTPMILTDSQTGTTDAFTGPPYYSSSAASAHNQNLPALSGMAGPPPQSSPRQPTQRAPSSEAQPNPQSLQNAPQGPPYSLPAISQTLQQTQMHPSAQGTMDRERELRERENRERDIMESHAAQQVAQQESLAKREAEQRQREMLERQQHEQAAHENHSGPIQIHQPVAVAPSTRTIHGPNGLLGQPGPLGGPHPLVGPMGVPNGPTTMFGGAPVQQGDTTPRMQHAVQPPPQPSMLMPFVGPGQMTAGQGGQQPILNVSKTFGEQYFTLFLLTFFRMHSATLIRSRFNLPITLMCITDSWTL
jgi:hypothetical protein